MNTQSHVKGIILAAGRGSRMHDRTTDRPKCLLPLAGKPLLQWQVEALRHAGIDEILVMRGYCDHMLTPQALPWAGTFSTANNPRWAHSNMLRTLLCAQDFVQSAFAQGTEKIIVSYSDIVYHHAHVKKLMLCSHDIGITYDTKWESLWKLRFGDPLLDAETFRQEHGLLCEIGEKPQSMHDIHGQYMGLLVFTHKGWQILEEHCAALGEMLDSTDMTSFLRRLLAHKVPVGAVPVAGKWCEGDSESDLENYETALIQGGWPHDWR